MNVLNVLINFFLWFFTNNWVTAVDPTQSELSQRDLLCMHITQYCTGYTSNLKLFISTLSVCVPFVMRFSYFKIMPKKISLFVWGELNGWWWETLCSLLIKSNSLFWQAKNFDESPFDSSYTYRFVHYTSPSTCYTEYTEYSAWCVFQFSIQSFS